MSTIIQLTSSSMKKTELGKTLLEKLSRIPELKSANNTLKICPGTRFMDENEPLLKIFSVFLFRNHPLAIIIDLEN